ncbi:hypothetical protein C0J52_12590 [Blattella germanica]|nr:hypothetical protein C0J52_12590 [Blattella germanica]
MTEEISDLSEYLQTRKDDRMITANDIIAKVAEVCNIEKIRKETLYPIDQPLKRAAAYTGLSISTIEEIKFSESHLGNSPLSPDRKRFKMQGKISIDESIVRDTIYDFYAVQKVVPTEDNLLPVLRDKTDWNWSATALRKELKKMGFVWKKVRHNCALLLERADSIGLRCQYIRKMKYYRELGRKIFYVDESWIDNNMITGKCWKREKKVSGEATSSKRLIIASVGSEDGFVPETQLIFESCSVKGQEMDTSKFEKWFCTQVLVNLPPASIIVINNGPYYCRQVDKTPSQYDTKALMLEWLWKKGVACDDSMMKCVLYTLIKAYKPSQKTYVIDVMAAEKGHTVVRLPPYNHDLNAMDLVWKKVETAISERNTPMNESLEDLRKLVICACSSVSASDWNGFCNHMKELEIQYWNKDVILDEAIDEVILNITKTNNVDDVSMSEDDLSSSDDDSDDSEYDSDEDDDDSDEDDDDDNDDSEDDFYSNGVDDSKTLL